MKTALKLVLGLAALALLLALGGIALTWAPDRSVEALAARWAPPPSTFVEVEGMRVHLRDEGPREDPEPVVLLHGTSASLHTWEGWAEALRGERRVVRFDLPGFGLTGPEPSGDYRMARYVRFTLAMLDKLGIERCALGGNSFGGALAWWTAAAAPERVARMILVDAAGYPTPAGAMPIGFRLAQAPVASTLMKWTLPRPVIVSSVRNVYGDPEKVAPALIDRYYELTLRAGNREALVQRFRQAPRGEDFERIATIRAPTLILWGGRDVLIPLEDAERFHRDIAGSRLVVFDDLGHVPHEEDPARTVEAVRTFLGDA